MENVTAWNVTRLLNQELVAFSQTNSIFRVIFLTFTVPIFAGNALVVVAVLTNRRLNQPRSVNLVSLALADMAVGFGIVLCFAIEDISVYSRNKTLCLSCVIFSAMSPGASFFTLLLVSLERYIAVVHPQKYVNLITKTRLVVASTTVWVYLGALGVVTIFWNDYSPSKACSMETVVPATFYSLVITCHVMLLLAVNAMLYILIIWKTVKHRNQVSDVTVAARAKEMEKRVHSMILIVMAAIYISWLPFLLHAFVPVYNSSAYYVTRNLALTLLYANSFTNPILYTWKSSDFRNAFRGLLSCGKWKATHQTTIEPLPKRRALPDTLPPTHNVAPTVALAVPSISAQASSNGQNPICVRN